MSKSPWAEHDNDDGPCCCGAWHKPGENNAKGDEELREELDRLRAATAVGKEDS